ncbi:hypothetical protein LT85_2182 [Collimonas arenae]|uniref:Uncharacterized protein n=1 Tax=Collimonas arenae TaxID=279058 RepID=A0A0A1FC55_9BURK|nr:hypothetical protein [Collimonas arenae]AIY41340.1 hypothetical protein LT85_2182 [Collimonas arenae]
MRFLSMPFPAGIKRLALGAKNIADEVQKKICESVLNKPQSLVSSRRQPLQAMFNLILQT